MNRLKEVRKNKGISQRKLAELSGISRQTIHMIESDPEFNAKVDTFKKLAEALGVDFSDIFFT
jgi:DNA-binding XRE family transcriptional regulator